MSPDKLHRRLRWLQLHAFFSTALVGVLALASFQEPPPDDRILRVRGIVVEDEHGRDRILIGAPVPSSPDRMRTDLDRVRAEWAPQLGGEQYMEHYATYRHDAGGILFLSETGHDRLVVGDQLPDPNTGRRLVEPTGLTFNDERGFERGGLGVSLTETGQSRVVLGMDDNLVGEAVHLFILEDGTRGLRIADADGQLFLGTAAAGSFVTGRDAAFVGLLATDTEGAVLLEHAATEQR